MKSQKVNERKIASLPLREKTRPEIVLLFAYDFPVKRSCYLPNNRGQMLQKQGVKMKYLRIVNNFQKELNTDIAKYKMCRWRFFSFFW